MADLTSLGAASQALARDSLRAGTAPSGRGMAYTDIAGLRRLQGDDQGALEQAAAQFESIFVGMWLQSMRDAGKVFSEGSYLSSGTLEMHQQMLDQQLAVQLAESGGIGLRDILVRQLGGGVEADAAAAREPSPQTRHDVPGRERFVGDLPGSVRRGEGASPGSDTAADAVAPDAYVRAGGYRDRLFDNAERFVAELRPVVEQIARAAGIHPLGVLAQAALETGWGSSVIHDAQGRPSNNLFGVKAHGWDGPSVDVTTMEFQLGQPVRRQDSFRAYSSVRDAVSDYVDFLKDRGRYADALSVADDPERYVDALQAAGYATDPNYASKIKQLIGQIGRMLHDT
ncbi:MAG: flagellar assembly peptidoglycan hydrolase FlgJ [Pseudomonadales bacterium]